MSRSNDLEDRPLRRRLTALRGKQANVRSRGYCSKEVSRLLTPPPFPGPSRCLCTNGGPFRGVGRAAGRSRNFEGKHTEQRNHSRAQQPTSA
jgi:hypothetical protein